MKIFQKTIIPFLICLLFSSCSSNKTEGNSIINKQIDSPSVPHSEFIRGAWMPYWDIGDAILSLEKKKGSLSFISPVWYEIEEGGVMKTKIKASAEEIFAISKKKKLDLIPSISLFYYEHLAAILKDDKKIEAHVNEIVQEVENNSFAGIDLDYESIQLTDKEKFFEFLEKLSQKLHANHKVLSVTVLAKWSDEIEYKTLPETREVQDWSRIAEYADQIRIMAYDYTFPKGKYPGPNAPLSWLNEVLEYATAKIPRSKIILGIPLYAYEWRTEEKEELPFIKNPFHNLLSEKSAHSFTAEIVKKILLENHGEKEVYEGEIIFRYRKENESSPPELRVLVFLDEEGVQIREELAHEFGIKGVVFWRLGGDLLK